jgi:dienelactone hydrolase
MRRLYRSLCVLLLLPALGRAETLPGTQPLTGEGDLARQMVVGIDRYLTRLTKTVAEKRRASWKPDNSSVEAYERSVQPKRARLKQILGVVDERLPVRGLEFVGGTVRDSVVAESELYTIQTVRWPVLPGIHGEGLWLRPRKQVAASVIVVPDAEQTPEMLAGLAPGVAPEAQVARRLAEQGCQVLVLTLVDRSDTWSGNPKVGRATNQPHREFVYRMAFEMGRHIIGYEVQKILALVDWLSGPPGHLPIGVFGYGEGGLLALHAAALDPRIEAVTVSGYFGPREELHAEPIYRNVFGLLRDFGDAEVASLIAPRGLVIEDAPQPKVDGPAAPRPGRAGAAPGRLPAPFGSAEVAREFSAATTYWKGLEASPHYRQPRLQKAAALGDSLPHLLGMLHVSKAAAVPQKVAISTVPLDSAARQKRQFEQLVRFTQGQLSAAVPRRKDLLWAKLNTSSPEAYQKSQAPARDFFWEEVIGKLPAPTLPMNPRTRLVYNEPKWKGYEVVLDLYEDVICFGILLVPTNLKPGEKRPVVVCQHGLEGRPADVVNPKVRTPYYNSFGAQLADRGFIVFAPQNPYIFGTEFRQTVRKANPLKLSLYSFIVRQHERILEWLVTLPYVDAEHIAYYGLSYGGKVAMRIPAILGRYCLSICSGDFNEWIWKNITLDWSNSYMFSGEYEMYEFDLGNTFNYAEMAALIAPRPFMVERGHSDGVGLDEYVAFEYAKVRRLYAQLGRADRTAIEFFVGGHVINGRGTFAFLHQHLNWPAPAK